jgi:hypothetical protein
VIYKQISVTVGLCSNYYINDNNIINCNNSNVIVIGNKVMCGSLCVLNPIFVIFLNLST